MVCYFDQYQKCSVQVCQSPFWVQMCLVQLWVQMCLVQLWVQMCLVQLWVQMCLISILSTSVLITILSTSVFIYILSSSRSITILNTSVLITILSTSVLITILSTSVLNTILSASVGLNSVHREIVSYVIIVFYDKVRGRNKAQRRLLLVCCGFFIWKRYNRTHFHRTILWLTQVKCVNHHSEHNIIYSWAYWMHNSNKFHWYSNSK
jgi:hypothetical protein